MTQNIRIGVDARPLNHPGGGNASYLYSMLKYAIRHNPQIEWILLAHRPLNDRYLDLIQRENVQLSVDHTPLFNPGLLWLNLKLPRLLREYQCDLFWATLAMLPLFYRKRLSSTPALVNFHDLNAFRAPQTMVAWNRWQHRLLDGHTLHNGDQILCLSQNTINDISDAFPNLDHNKLKLVYPGCELPEAAAQAPAESLPESFILAVGTIEPRKNYSTLIQGYLAAQAKNRNLLPLLIIGRKGWGEKELFSKLKEKRYQNSNIFYLEDASDNELRWAYEKAAFLAFPSLHEGFGLPLVEALKLGKAALLSDIPIFREIAPDATFVPATAIESWSEKLLEIEGSFRRGELSPPKFDDELWSWESRARVFTDLIDSYMSQRDNSHKITE